MKRKYTKLLADEMEACGVALRVSGAYVHRSFDSDELELLKQIAKQNHDFEKDLSVVVANGRGVLVRHAKLSKDRQMASYLGKIVSLKLLNGQAYSISAFAEQVRKNSVLKIMIKSTGEKKIGVLFGSLNEPYATLVHVSDGRLRFTDIEMQERSNNRDVVCEILPLTPEGEARGRTIQEALTRIAKGEAC